MEFRNLIHLIWGSWLFAACYWLAKPAKSKRQTANKIKYPIMMKKRWQKQVTPDILTKTLAETCKIDSVIARLLIQRGIRTAEAATRFLNPSLDYLHHPFLMKNMEKAVKRLDLAIRSNEKILLYGDYDVDGTTSVAMMYQFLSQYTDQLDYYIPNRYREGYGLSISGIDYAKTKGCTLLIAMDCGIKAVDEVAYANTKNIDVIICDHHLPGAEIPDALAVLDPLQEDCDYPFKKLCGCGVSFKLAQAYTSFRKESPEKWYHLLDLVAIGTACDIVPLLDENRILVHAGLKQLNESPRPGLVDLLKNRQGEADLKVSDLVFGVGPVINAAGRLEDAKSAVKLLLAKSSSSIIALTEKLLAMNEDRKMLDKKTLEEAKELLESTPGHEHQNSIVLYHPEWHRGVIGIVASRMVDHYQKPTILLTEADGKLVGSARSVSTFNLYQAIDSCKKWLENFGGHQYAAGLTLSEKSLKSFQADFESTVSNRITLLEKSPVISVADLLPVEKINLSFWKKIQQLAPFGPKNRNPVFVTQNLKSGSGTRLLKNNHLKLAIESKDGKLVSGIGFGLGDKMMCCAEKNFSLCYTLEKNTWKGKEEVQLNIKDVR